MSYEILFTRSAQKELNNLPQKIGDRILKKIDVLAENPRPSGCKKLEVSENTYRLRVSDYRIIYSIFDRQLIVEIIKIDHRKQVYR